MSDHKERELARYIGDVCTLLDDAPLFWECLPFIISEQKRGVWDAKGTAEFLAAAHRPNPNHQTKEEFMQLVETIANMKQDGEDDFVMENDDAVDTINNLIRAARELREKLGAMQ